MSETEQDLVKLTPPMCIICSKDPEEVEVTRYEANLWTSGTPIQDAMPERSSEFREILITGTHPECWEAMLCEDGES